MLTYRGTAAGTDFGTLQIVTSAVDDPMTPVNESIAEITLTAITNGPDIAAIPDTLSFGAVGVGGSMAKTVRITNEGNRVLHVSSLLLDARSGQFTLARAPALPAAVGPGSSVEVDVQFAPGGTGADTGNLVVPAKRDRRRGHPLRRR